MVALFSATFCAPAAIASTTESNDQSSLGIRNVISTERVSVNFSARVVLTDSSGPQVLDVTDKSKNLSEVLSDNSLDISDFRTSSDTALDEKYLLQNSEDLAIFKSEVSGNSEIITLKAPEERRDSDTLFKGEEKVESEGVDGEALKTTINTKSLAADTNVNTATEKKSDNPNSVEEKLTVLKAPETRIVLVGTKERPAEVPAAPSTPAATAAVASNTPATPGAPAAKTMSAASTPDNFSAPASGGVSALAMAQIGKAYVYGATGPNAFDCSGLVQYVFSNNGKNVPRTAVAQGMSATPISRADIQPGDIIWTDFHIGIYVGNGKMVHASSPSTGVIIDNVQAYLDQGYRIGRL